MRTEGFKVLLLTLTTISLMVPAIAINTVSAPSTFSASPGATLSPTLARANTSIEFTVTVTNDYAADNIDNVILMAPGFSQPTDLELNTWVLSEITNGVRFDAIGDNVIAPGGSETFVFVWTTPNISTQKDYMISMLVSKEEVIYTAYENLGGFSVTIDGKKPTLIINVTQAGVTAVNVVGTALDNAKATITITASETLQSIGTVTVENSGWSEENFLPPIPMTTTDNIVYTGTFTVGAWDDNVPVVKVASAKDMAGNEITNIENSFTTDTWAPVFIDNGLASLVSGMHINVVQTGTDTIYRYADNSASENMVIIVQDNAIGEADNGKWVTSVTIDAQTAIRDPMIDNRWTKTINLSEGLNSIVKVTATDRTGNTASDNVENIFIDTRPPTIEFNTVAGKTWDENDELINDNTPEIKITVLDPSYPTSGLGVARIAANNDNLRVTIDEDDDMLNGSPYSFENLENKAAWDPSTGAFENLIDNASEGLADGTYWINVVASDNLAHAGTFTVRASRSFTIETQKPFIPHDPIYIDGNDNFTLANGVVGGNGTENDPYIIKNWDIIAENAHGIEIRNTTTHFVIRNCYVHDGWATSKHGIHLDNVKNGEIDNSNLENNDYGIRLDNSSNNRISNNIVKYNHPGGIYFYYSDNNLIINSVVENNHFGIDSWYSDNNLIINNHVEKNYTGIHLVDSYNNFISNNIVKNNPYDGINLGISENNLVENNLVENNYYGIYLNNSGNNSIYHNNFMNNVTQASDDGPNYWDDGYPSGGNYWSNYVGEDNYRGENQNILGSDGIGDTQYYIPRGNNRDRYPLMNPWSAIRGVEVSISPSYQSGPPRTTLVYTVTVKNTGNVEDNYALTVSDNVSWGPSISPNWFVLAPSASSNATLSVTVPADALAEVVGNENQLLEWFLEYPSAWVRDGPWELDYGDPIQEAAYPITITKSGRLSVHFYSSIQDQAWSRVGDTYRIRAGGINPGNILENITTIIDIGSINVTGYEHIHLYKGTTENVYPPGNYWVSDVGGEGRILYWHPTPPTSLSKWSIDGGHTWATWWGGHEYAVKVEVWGEGAAPSTEDNITVIATSQTDNTVIAEDSCIAHAVEPEVGIRTAIYPAADVFAFSGDETRYSRSQLKFDIRDIPSGSNILSAKLWLHRFAADNWDGEILLNRVDDQLWSENITAIEFDAQTLTDEETQAGKFTSHGWDYLDVKNQLNVDHEAGRTYSSYRLMWANDNGGEPSIGIDDGRFLVIGCELEELSIIFSSSEYDGKDPYLEVVYLPPYVVSLSISPTYKSGPPGEKLSYAVTVANTGGLDDNYVLTVSDDAGWSPTVFPTSLSVASGAVGEATLTVTVPENGTPCTTDNIIVIATSQTDNSVSDNAWCEAHVEIVRRVEISISPSYQSGLLCENLEYTVTVRNLGNVEENYDFIAQDTENWGPMLEDGFLEVPAGENRQTTLGVIIPANAVPCTEDNITIIAISQENVEVSDSASCVAHAAHVGPIPRGPIYINRNENFIPANGVTSGSGTENDPYIIENWDISAENANGIEIRNTTANFVVRNCVVENGPIYAYYGISLGSVVNGSIENNTCENNYYGIFLYDSDNNNLTNNTCENNIYYGIRLYLSDHNILTNNTCESNDYGINLDYLSNYNTIEKNACSNSEKGIYLVESSHNNLINNTCENNAYGIRLDNSDNNTLFHNTCKNSSSGIYLDYLCNYNILDNNTCERNDRCGIYLKSSSNYNTLSNNTCSNSYDHGIYLDCWCNYNILNNNTCENNRSGIYLDAWSNYNTFSNNTCENSSDRGIYLSYYSDNNTLDNNTCSNNPYGIVLYKSGNNIITNNTCSSNGYYGIRLDYSVNNTLTNNTCENNSSCGIELYSSDNNIIEKNSSCGIELYYSDNNIIENNLVENNRFGITLNVSDNNTIYHNNFVNNGNQAYDDGSNHWDNGYPSGGNYWSDYTGVDNYRGENQEIPGSDGIGDTPYYIPGDNNLDRYPLMEPWPPRVPEEIFTVSPAEFTVIDAPLGVPLIIPQRLVVWNRDNIDRVALVSVEVPPENAVRPGYEPIPNENWVLPLPSLIVISENSFAEIQLALDIPRWENLTGQRWEAWISVKRIAEPGEIFELELVVRAKIETIEELPPIPTEWDASLTATFSSGSDDAIFGVRPDATSGFDNAYDIPEPPPPVAPPYVRAFFHYPGQTPDELHRSCLAPENLMEWPLRVEYAEGSEDITLTWRVQNIPLEYSVHLYRGENLVADMRAEDNYTFEASTGSYDFKIVVWKVVPFTLELAQGWNMISFPVLPENSSPDAIFGSYYALYRWDAQNKRYVLHADSGSFIEPDPNVEAGVGYWAYVLKNENVDLLGVPVNRLTLNLHQGWNLIGPPYCGSSIADPIDDPDNTVLKWAFTWDADQRRYVTTQLLKPGKGYWVYALRNCSLVFLKLKLAIVYDIGGRGDLGFNDIAYMGGKRAQQELSVELVEMHSMTEADYVPNLRAAAEDPDTVLIVGVGYLLSEALAEVAQEFPDKNFMGIDTYARSLTPRPLPNLMDVVFEEHKGSALVGALGALLATHYDYPHIGAVLGTEIPVLWKFEIGYKWGCDWAMSWYENNFPENYAADPDNSIVKTPKKERVLWDYTGTFTDITKGYTAAKPMYDKGAVAVYNIAGPLGLGINQAVNEIAEAENLETGPPFWIGVDADQDWINPGFVIASMMKRVDYGVYHATELVLGNKFRDAVQEYGGVIKLGIGTGVLGIPIEGISVSTLDDLDAFLELGIEAGIIDPNNRDAIYSKVKEMREAQPFWIWEAVEELENRIRTGVENVPEVDTQGEIDYWRDIFG